MKKACKKDNRMILWFEVDDTGCGRNLKTFYNDIETLHPLAKLDTPLMNKINSKFIFVGIDPSKWESVFESFEQADPSTTRT